MQPSLRCYRQRLSVSPAVVRVFTRFLPTSPNQTRVGQVFAVSIDLSARQIVKLWLFISISYHPIGRSQQLQTLRVPTACRLRPSTRKSRTLVGREG